MHQDKVVVVIITKEPQEGKRREGIVVKSPGKGYDPDCRNLSRTAGTYGFVVSDNPKFSKDVFIPKKRFPRNQGRG